MKLVPVDYIPEEHNNRPKKDLAKMLYDFLNSEHKYAEVILEDDDYCRIESARHSLMLACRRYGYAIDVKTRRGRLFLAKRWV